jgi:hypothetical protein
MENKIRHMSSEKRKYLLRFVVGTNFDTSDSRLMDMLDEDVVKNSVQIHY